MRQEINELMRFNDNVEKSRLSCNGNGCPQFDSARVAPPLRRWLGACNCCDEVITFEVIAVQENTDRSANGSITVAISRVSNLRKRDFPWRYRDNTKSLVRFMRRVTQKMKMECAVTTK